MTVATIDLANNAVHFHFDKSVAKEYADDHDQLLVRKASDLYELTRSQAVTLFNAFADKLHQKHVRQFRDRYAAAEKIIDQLKTLWTSARVENFGNGSLVTRRSPGINLQPKAKALPCKEGTKQALLVDLLSRKEGASMIELIRALSANGKAWQEVTVKSGLHWDMHRVKGYGIRTEVTGPEARYHLVLPAGLKAPIPHTPRKK